MRPSTTSKSTSSKHSATNPRSSKLGSGPTEARPPVIELSHHWLTVSLIAVALVPVVLAGTVWYAIPTKPEPVLSAELTFEPVAWPPGSSDSVRLMPGLRIHNPTPDRWSNVSMGINQQFYFYCAEPVEAGGSISVPLALFKTSGNQAYRPKSVPLKQLTVYAQLPSKRRAILEVENPKPGN